MTAEALAVIALVLLLLDEWGTWVLGEPSPFVDWAILCAVLALWAVAALMEALKRDREP